MKKLLLIGLIIALFTGCYMNGDYNGTGHIVEKWNDSTGYWVKVDLYGTVLPVELNVFVYDWFNIGDMVWCEYEKVSGDIVRIISISIYS